MTTTDREPPASDLLMLVNGARTAARSGRTYASTDPFTGQPWAHVPDAAAADVDDAVAAARAALAGPWGRLTATQRGRLLHRLGDLIARDAGHLAELETRDNGKLLREMSGQLAGLPDWYYYYAGLADKVQGSVIPSDKPGYLVYTLNEPAGVVAAIVPWNSARSVWRLRRQRHGPGERRRRDSRVHRDQVRVGGADRRHPGPVHAGLTGSVCPPARRVWLSCDPLQGGDMPGIVVGVDGSAHALRALEWAMREAAIHHADLTVLTINPAMASPWTGRRLTMPGEAQAKEQSRQAVEQAIAQAAAEIGDQQPVSVTVSVFSGFPAQALIDASRDADMIVIGSRGTGGFEALLLGSISSQVTHHAECPVVIVPSDRPRAKA